MTKTILLGLFLVIIFIIVGIMNLREAYKEYKQEKFGYAIFDAVIGIMCFGTVIKVLCRIFELI